MGFERLNKENVKLSIQIVGRRYRTRLNILAEKALHSYENNLQ